MTQTATGLIPVAGCAGVDRVGVERVALVGRDRHDLALVIAEQTVDAMQRSRNAEVATPRPATRFCNAKTELRGPIREVVQVEATHYLPIYIDEHVKNGDTGLLFRQECTMSLSELLKEIVTPIANGSSEVSPVRLFKARTADS